MTSDKGIDDDRKSMKLEVHYPCKQFSMQTFLIKCVKSFPRGP